MAELAPIFLGAGALLMALALLRLRRGDSTALLLGIALLFVGAVCILVAGLAWLMPVRLS